MFSPITKHSKHTECSGSAIFDDKLCTSKGDEASKRPQLQTKPKTPSTKARGILSMFKDSM